MNLDLVYGEELFELDLLNDDPWSLANKVNVTILSDKELLASIVDNDKSIIIAAIFDSFFNNKYSFDTVVDPKYQGIGIGKKLIRIAMDKFNELSELDENIELELEIINPKITEYLKREYNLIEVKEKTDREFLGI